MRSKRVWVVSGALVRDFPLPCLLLSHLLRPSLLGPSLPLALVRIPISSALDNLSEVGSVVYIQKRRPFSRRFFRSNSLSPFEHPYHLSTLRDSRGGGRPVL